jgi:hypothetical protein
MGTLVEGWTSYPVEGAIESSAGPRRRHEPGITDESLNDWLHKFMKTRGHFPSEEAATKLLCLALVRAEQR